jgi:mycothiol synthase
VHDSIEGEGSGFDPTLWFVAREGDEIVGAITCRASTPSAPDTAHVDVLGVRRAWRNRGLGAVLLLTAFAEIRRQAIPAVELVVDSESQTGATRLYERAGMRRLRGFEHWQKELGPSVSTP